MYRLPNGGSGNALQKAISRELINAFTVVFGVTISENDISLDWARLMNFLEENQLLNTPMVSDEMWELRIIGMLRELSDPSYEYTFDLLGEYILYKVLCAVSEFDDESWQTSVTAEEMIELYSMIACSKTIACMEVCEVDELSELSRIEMTELMNDITTTIWNILHAPEYLQILDEYIMWDCDYLLLEDIGMENMLCLLKEPAFVNELGLVESSDQCEPITGSIKRAICEQKK